MACARDAGFRAETLPAGALTFRAAFDAGRLAVTRLWPARFDVTCAAGGRRAAVDCFPLAGFWVTARCGTPWDDAGRRVGEDGDGEFDATGRGALRVGGALLPGAAAADGAGEALLVVTAPRTTGRRDGDLGWTEGDADGRTDARGVGLPAGRGAPAVTPAVGTALAFGATLVDGVGRVVGRTGTGLVDPPDVPAGEATGWGDVGGSVTTTDEDEGEPLGGVDRAGTGRLVRAGRGEGNADGSTVGALDGWRGSVGDGAADR